MYILSLPLLSVEELLRFKPGFLAILQEDYISQPPLQLGAATELSPSQWDVSGSDVLHFGATFLEGRHLLSISSLPLCDWTMEMGMELGGSFDNADKDDTLGLSNQQDMKNLSFIRNWRKRALNSCLAWSL